MCVCNSIVTQASCFCPYLVRELLLHTDKYTGPCSLLPANQHTEFQIAAIKPWTNSISITLCELSKHEPAIMYGQRRFLCTLAFPVHKEGRQTTADLREGTKKKSKGGRGRKRNHGNEVLTGSATVFIPSLSLPFLPW